MAAVDVVELNAAKPSGGSETKHGVDAVIDFLGGVAGGVASVYVGQPLDTVKVKMQTFPTMYSNAFRCFVTTLKQDGLARGLYAGTVPSLWAQVSENAVLFMAYGFCQKGVMKMVGKSNVEELSILQKATAGGCAAVFSSLVLCPTELIKCKQQAMKEMSMTGQLEGSLAKDAKLKHIGPWSLTKQVLREEGFRGLFRGLVPTFAREVPGYFFFFGGYEVSCMLMTPAGGTKDDLPAWKTLIAGGIGGICLWLSIFPADLIKSRAQIQTGAEVPFLTMFASIARNEGPWQTALCGGIGGATLWIMVFPTDVIKSRVQVVKQTESRTLLGLFFHILRNEGIAALYKGLGPTLLRTFPATGALFLAYENTTRILSNLAKPSEHQL